MPLTLKAGCIEKTRDLLEIEPLLVANYFSVLLVSGLLKVTGLLY